MKYSVSPTLEVNERVAARRREGAEVIHLGFGEAGLPVHPLLREELAAAAHLNAYEPVAGGAELRAAIASWFERRSLPTDADSLLVTPGSKAGLFGLLMALPGDVVLPCPAWVSYAPQAELLGKRVIRHPIPAVAGGIPDPATLAASLAEQRSRGLDPGILVLTVPDNPTGTYPPSELMAQLAEVARAEGLAIVADEIYRELAYVPEVPSIAAMAPERTFVTTGLSKAQALGGWRFGVVRVPASELGERTKARLRAIASEVWSAVPSPIARAARVAYEEPPELTSYLEDGRRVHRALATAVHELVERVGMSCRPPQAAFYLYPGLPEGPESDREVAARLLERSGIAVLPGSAFGDDPAARRLRLATSLLCGADEAERWEALDAAREGQLLSLPRIERTLGRIEDGFRATLAES